MAKYFKSSQVPSDDPYNTVVKIINISGQNLVKKAVIIWEGSLPANIPNLIPSNETPKKFTHDADGVVGLEYKFNDEITTLIVAWSKNGPCNRVYADIIAAGSVDCDQIKNNLDKSAVHTSEKLSFECVISIDSSDGTFKVEVKVLEEI